eukprot:tig00020554_g10890.t1
MWFKDLIKGIDAKLKRDPAGEPATRQQDGPTQTQTDARSTSERCVDFSAGVPFSQKYEAFSGKMKANNHALVSRLPITLHQVQTLEEKCAQSAVAWQELQNELQAVPAVSASLAAAREQLGGLAERLEQLEEVADSLLRDRKEREVVRFREAIAHDLRKYRARKNQELQAMDQSLRVKRASKGGAGGEALRSLYRSAVQGLASAASAAAESSLLGSDDPQDQPTSGETGVTGSEADSQRYAGILDRESGKFKAAAADTLASAKTAIEAILRAERLPGEAQAAIEAAMRQAEAFASAQRQAYTGPRLDQIEVEAPGNQAAPSSDASSAVEPPGSVRPGLGPILRVLEQGQKAIGEAMMGAAEAQVLGAVSQLQAVIAKLQEYKGQGVAALKDRDGKQQRVDELLVLAESYLSLSNAL